MRARVTVTVLAFFVALAATGTPASMGAAAGAVDRAQALGGETERTPVVASHATPAQLHAVRFAGARPVPWKLPLAAPAINLGATLVSSESTRAVEAAHAPIAPPSAPRSCRGPPQA